MNKKKHARVDRMVGVRITSAEHADWTRRSIKVHRSLSDWIRLIVRDSIDGKTGGSKSK